jgi:cytochrome c oxidase subunit 4
MESMSIEHVKKSVRVYLFVFVALMALTIITVAVSTLHLSVGAAIAVALFIASIKAFLVAGYFMHLLSEKKLIYSTLILTAIFFAALMFLPVSHYLDNLFT